MLEISPLTHRELQSLYQEIFSWFKNSNVQKEPWDIWAYQAFHTILAFTLSAGAFSLCSLWDEKHVQ